MAIRNLPVIPPAPSRPPAPEAAEDLLSELSRTVRGEVRFDRATRALYASDLSVYRHVPIGVVIPAHMDDVVATVAACHRRGIPILSRGCGTSLAGQTCNVAVVLDFSRLLNRIVALDPVHRTATVEPGVICDQLRDAAEHYHLTFAPDPATHAYCTLGGMIGNNSCGPHSIMGGKTVDNVEELEILTYDGLRMRVGETSDVELASIIAGGGRRGEIYARLKALRDRYAPLVRERFPKIPRRVSGYNLDQLLPENGFHVARALVGTESTCVTVLEAKLRLVPSPLARALLVLGYPDPGAAGDAVVALREAHSPIALEAFHTSVLEHLRIQGKRPRGQGHLPPGNTWLLVEFGGEDAAEAAERARRALDATFGAGRVRGGRVLTDPGEQDAVWQIRESGVGSSYLPGVEPAYPSWEDAAVPPERLGDYLRRVIALMDRYGYHYTLYGHFGDGCVHTRISFDLKTPEGVARFRAFVEEAVDLVVAHGGVPSGEHGDGECRAEFYPKVFGPELVEAFREFKAIWDPDNRMNPGKIVDPYPLDANLRLGEDYAPRPVWTHFHYPHDHGRLSEATERCFGVGKCRRLDEGTMCPSFKVVREEQHTTRGRARLLFEMLRGDSVLDGWRDEGVKEALDLCLSCKGCKGDCPTSTDVATYRAEFLAHYYEGRRRPPHALALGRVASWLRLAGRAPALANLLARPRLPRALLGIAPERPAPPLAATTFQQRYARRPRAHKDPAAPKVVLWPDTFNNHFYPETAEAALEVLEHAGYHVIVPQGHLCCGRPLYDYGMLDLAKTRLREVLAALRPHIRSNTPVVGLEPSCAAVFRDELTNLFPDDPDARRLSRQTYSLAELLARTVSFRPPQLEGQAVLHGHCHQKALWSTDPDATLLGRLGLEVERPDTGCCGLAGSFGYEADKYDLSMRIGELALFPAVRRAAPSAFIVADGFSCRSQVEHGTDRQALHTAELLHLALREAAPGGVYPERAIVRERARPSRAAAALTATALAAAGAVWWARSRSRSR